MFEQIPYFIPSIVSIVWAGIYIFKKKNLSQRFLFALLIVKSYYLVSCALYLMPNPDYQLMAKLDLLNFPLSLALIALISMYFLSHDRVWEKVRRLIWVLLLPSFVYLIINLLLVYLLDTDGIADFYRKIYKEGYIPSKSDGGAMLLYYNLMCVVHNWISGFLLLIALACGIWVSVRQGYRFGDVYRFFFRRATSTPTRVICFLYGFMLVIMLVVLLCNWVFPYPAISYIIMLLLAVGIHCLSYVEYVSHLPQVTLYMLAHAEFFLFNEQQENTNGATPEIEKPDTNQNQDTIPASEPVIIDSTIQASLTQLLRKALEEEQIYRDPDLSIMSLAQHLGTNRTTLSLVINTTYGQNFRQLLSNYRISAAKKYIRENPEASQNEISAACGFVSAQTFNAKFKEATSLTPRQWQLEGGK